MSPTENSTRSRRRSAASRVRGLVAGVTLLTLLVAACNGGSDSADTTTTTGPVGEPTEVIARRDPSGCTPETTTGCVTVNDGAPAEGRYTLFNNMSPDQTGTILIDGEGAIVNEWPTNGVDAVPLPEPGTILAGLEPPGPISIARIIAFSTPCLAIMNWEGETIWPTSAAAGAECGEGIEPIRFEVTEAGEPTANAHHDLQAMGAPVYATPEIDETSGDGRVLYLSHRPLSAEESLRVTTNGEINDDRIVEIAEDGEEVLWEWSAGEHIDQLGFDDDAIAAIADSTGGQPPAIAQAAGVDGGPPMPYGWLFTNSASYLGPNRHCEDPDSDECDWRFHPDNVLVGSRQAALMFIVARHDHPDGEWEEGDVVWTLGPDFDETSFGPISGQHHAHMIPSGLPGEGNVLIFDNGSAAGFGTNADGELTNSLYDRDYSRILEIDPTTMELMWSYEQPETGADGTPKLDAFNISSAQRLPGGNTLITEGNSGRIFEVTVDGEIVWEFVSPYEALSIIPSQMFAVSVYRSYRVPPTWVPDGTGS